MKQDGNPIRLPLLETRKETRKKQGRKWIGSLWCRLIAFAFRLSVPKTSCWIEVVSLIKVYGISMDTCSLNTVPYVLQETLLKQRKL